MMFIMYKLTIPQEDLKKLYLMREYLGLGTIAGQVKLAIQNFIKNEEKKIGTSIFDATEGIARHEIEKSQSCLVEQD